jgi:hypothetical protein
MNIRLQDWDYKTIIEVNKMNEFSQFKLYKTGPFYKLGTIYAIVTGSKSENSNHIETEWFYYVTFSHKNAGFKISSSYFENIEHFWDSYVLESLQEAIYFDELVPVLDEIKDFSFYTKVELQEIKNENLIYLSIENMDFVNYLKKHTICSELRKIIDILPMIEFEKRKIV